MISEESAQKFIIAKQAKGTPQYYIIGLRDFLAAYEKDDIQGMARFYRVHNIENPIHEALPHAKRSTTRDRHSLFAHDYRALVDFDTEAFQKHFHEEEFASLYENGDIYHMALYYKRHNITELNTSVKKTASTRSMDLDYCHSFAFQHRNKIESPEELLKILNVEIEKLNGDITDFKCAQLMELKRRIYFNKLLDPQDNNEDPRKKVAFENTNSRFICNQAEIYVKHYPDIFSVLLPKDVCDAKDRLLKKFRDYKETENPSSQLLQDIILLRNDLVVKTVRYFYKEGIFRDRVDISKMPQDFQDNYHKLKNRLVEGLLFTVCGELTVALYMASQGNPQYADPIEEGEKNRLAARAIEEIIKNYSTKHHHEIVKVWGNKDIESAGSSSSNSRSSSPEKTAEQELRENPLSYFFAKPFDQLPKDGYYASASSSSSHSKSGSGIFSRRKASLQKPQAPEDSDKKGKKPFFSRSSRSDS